MKMKDSVYNITEEARSSHRREGKKMCLVQMFFIFLNILLCVWYTCGCTCHCVRTWRWDDNCMKLVLSYLHVRSRDWAQSSGDLMTCACYQHVGLCIKEIQFALRKKKRNVNVGRAQHRAYCFSHGLLSLPAHQSHHVSNAENSTTAAD